VRITVVLNATTLLSAVSGRPLTPRYVTEAWLRISAPGGVTDCPDTVTA
jgi:hypothetical protein